jgi:hypothetical protein
VWGCAVPQACCHGRATAAERRRACSGREGGLRPTGSSATGRKRCRGAHRGLELAGKLAQGGRQRGPSGEDEAALAERVDAGVLRASDPHGQVQRRTGKPGK